VALAQLGPGLAQCAAQLCRGALPRGRFMHTDHEQTFQTTISEGIAELVFDHPPVNAFDSNGWAALAAEIDRSAPTIRSRDHDRRRGAGLLRRRRHQGAGGHRSASSVNKGNYDTFQGHPPNPKPVIVAVHGFVLGGGIGMSRRGRRRWHPNAPASACPRSTAVPWAAAPTCSACSRCRRCATCISPAR
jgi:hypothetical protein